MKRKTQQHRALNYLFPSSKVNSLKKYEKKQHKENV